MCVCYLEENCDKLLINNNKLFNPYFKLFICDHLRLSTEFINAAAGNGRLVGSATKHATWLLLLCLCVILLMKKYLKLGISNKTIFLWKDSSPDFEKLFSRVNVENNIPDNNRLIAVNKNVFVVAFFSQFQFTFHSLIIISMIPKRILLQNYILSGVVAVVAVVVSLFTTAPTTTPNIRRQRARLYVCTCVCLVCKSSTTTTTRNTNTTTATPTLYQNCPHLLCMCSRRICRRHFTCSRTGPRGAWCCLCGSRAASCTCPAPGARSPGGSCRSPSPSCRPGTGRGLA